MSQPGPRGHSSLPAAASASGIELVLVAGQSPTTMQVVFTPEVPPTRAILGASSQADWPMIAAGVEAQHAEIAWDGTTLWIRDVGTTSGTFVDEQRIRSTDWRPLTYGETIRIGQAVLMARAPVVTNQSFAVGEIAQHASGPRHHGRDDFDDDQATQVAARPSELSMLQDDSPMVGVSSAPRSGFSHSLPRAPSTADRPAVSTSGQTSQETVIVQSPFAEENASPPPPRTGRIAVPPPRVGGSSVSAQRKAPPPPTLTADQMPKLPGVGPSPDGTPSEPTVVVSDSISISASAISQGAAAPVTHSTAMAPTPSATVSALTSSGASLATVSLSAESALPSFSSGSGNSPPGELTQLFGSIPPPPPPPSSVALKNPLAALPRRTLILLSVTLVAGVVLLVSLFSTPAGPSHVTTSRVPQSSEPPRPVLVFTPPIPGPPAGPTGTLLAATNPPPPPPVDPRRPPPPAPPPTTLPERIAADAIVQGRYRDAIPLYEALALAHPDTPVYAHIVTILRRKLEAQQSPCTPGGPTPCAPVVAPSSSSH